MKPLPILYYFRHLQREHTHKNRRQVPILPPDTSTLLVLEENMNT